MKPWTIILLTLCILLLTSCSGAAPAPVPGANINGPITEDSAGENFPFTIPVPEAHALIGLDFRANLQSGALTAVLEDMDGKVIWQATAEAGRPFSVNTVVRPERSGDYRLGLRWEGPVKGTYALQWRAGEIPVAQVQPIALLSGLGMILVGIGFIGYGLMREASGRYLLWGALAWVGSIALKFAWAIPFNGPIYQALTQTLGQTAGQLLFYLYVGALTGIFEVLLVWLLLRYTRLGQAIWSDALGFGLAFGAVEAILLGLSSFTNVLLALLSPESFTPTRTTGAPQQHPVRHRPHLGALLHRPHPHRRQRRPVPRHRPPRDALVLDQFCPQDPD